MKIFNTVIDLKSFLLRQPPFLDDDFGNFMVCGYMGSGKTYFAIYYLEHFSKNRTIYTNIKSYRNSNKNIIYFDNPNEIVNVREKNCIFLIDECSQFWSKDSKIDKEFYQWSQFARKDKRTCILIYQEYLNVPQWLRGIYINVYTTHKMAFLPLFHTFLGYAVLDEDTFEWTIEPRKHFIYKRNKIITDRYNTFS